MSLISLLLVLFLIMNPLGNAQAFMATIRHVPPTRRRLVIAREMCIGLIAMVFFDFVGEYIFSLLQISPTTVYLSSAIVLFLSAIPILFPSERDGKERQHAGEPVLVPLAIPMIASPALLATIMLYAGTEPSPWTMLWAIFVAWLLSGCIYSLAPRLLAVVGSNGLTACEKLMGMILVLIAINRFLEGIVHFKDTLVPL